MMRLRCRAFDHALADRGGREPNPLHRAHALDVVRVSGQQFFGDELDQHVVVAFEGGEHIGVAAQCDQPVLRQIACAAASFAGLLNRGAGVPRADRLQAGSPGFQFALCLGIGDLGGLHFVQLAHQLVLRELQRVRFRDERQQPTLMDQIIHQDYFLLVAGALN